MRSHVVAALGALALRRALATPCDATIPGPWADTGRTDNLTWAPAPPVFTTTWPHGSWKTMNGTFSPDFRTVIGHFSNGHVGHGKVSEQCDFFEWDDSTTWMADVPVPQIRVHVAPHTHDDVGWDETYSSFYALNAAPATATITT